MMSPPRRATTRPAHAGVIVVAYVAAACLAGAACAAEPALGAGSQDALRSAGPQSGHILDLWRLTLALCTAVFAAVLIAFFLALWRTPRATAATPADLTSFEHPEPRVRRRVAMAVGATITVIFVLIGASIATDRALAHLALRDAVHVEVTGHQWWWELRYDDPVAGQVFTTANELHVPVGRPVLLTLQADDVIHSFWVPNLAGKKDLIPGRTATLQFRADRAGTYRGQCAEFCGLEHAWMAFSVVADEPAAYEAWAAAQRQPAAAPAEALARRGEAVFHASTCAMCHAVAGTEAGGRRAPDLTHVASRRTLAAGALPNTPANMARWIADPQRIKPGTNMPAHGFAKDDMDALVAYLGSLK